jgi:DDE family transposase
MQPARAGSLLSYLAQVPDPRGRKGRRHDLSALLTAVVCGILCGARGYAQITEWLHEQTVDVWHWMGFRRRPPKLDCFRDLLMKLDPTALQETLQSWIIADLGLFVSDESLSGVSIDGKTLCATLRAFSKAVHLLAAVDHRTGCVLSQSRVDEKTNEHKGALELLKTLVLQGRVVLGDAAFCQRDVCQQILQAGGDYFLAVKENQPGLRREIEHEFAAQEAAFSPLPTAAAAI